MITRHEILQLLTMTDTDRESLFADARAARARVYSDRVVLRGVVEVTNLCKVNCDYCPMRRDNTKANEVFRISGSGLLDSIDHIRSSDINVVFFQAGEIRGTTKLVGEVIPRIRDMYDDNVEVLLNLGNKSRDEYSYLRDQGATSYILKHETSDPVLHQRLRHESLRERLRCIEDLLDLGYRVGTGMIVGLPDQTLSSIADDIVLAKKLGVHMCSASPFIPAPNTPMEHVPPGSVETTLNAIAAMRLVSPNWLIPTVSALEKLKSGGQEKGLRAGANVMTVNFTPDTQLHQYLIYGKDRFVVKSEHARRVIRSAGLQPSRSVFVGGAQHG